MSHEPYEVVVVGASWGGLAALNELLSPLPYDFNIPILIVQHRQRNQFGSEHLIDILNNNCKLQVIEPDDKDIIQSGNIYIAPANYHLLVESKYKLALSSDEPVNFSRPAIDLLFESAAFTYQQAAVGIILTGANKDGAYGLSQIKKLGGLAIVQDPTTAESETMPLAAVKSSNPDWVLTLKKISELLIRL